MHGWAGIVWGVCSWGLGGRGDEEGICVCVCVCVCVSLVLTPSLSLPLTHPAAP